MGNVRFRSIFYNTTVTGSGSPVWKIEIEDQEAVAQVINFELDAQPDDSFEGLTQDLKAGIFTSSLKFGFVVRDTPKIRSGTTYGPSNTFIPDIFTSPEGRFIVKYYKDDVLKFVGPIIYDQCSYESMASPYILQITAVDGLVRWQTQDYISEVGQIKYKSFEDDNNIAYDNTPLDFGLPGTEWVMIENRVWRFVIGGDYWKQITTYARREMYSGVSPGTGWVDQGTGIWAKEVDYTNEQEYDNSPELYYLTRDIDDAKKRTVLEFFTRSMFQTKLTDEYPSPDCMFDTSIAWRENNMGDLDLSCESQMRLSEDPFLGKTWAEGMQEICKLLNIRIYFANGRYHFEQISLRDEDGFTRYTYESDGTLIGTETATLDLDFDALEIEPETNATNRVLAPFRSVEASIDFDSSNLLNNVQWSEGNMGDKYLGRIKRQAGTMYASVRIPPIIISFFDLDVLETLPESLIALYCKHRFTTFIHLRISNVALGITYWWHGGSTNAWLTIPPTNGSTIIMGGDNDPYSLESPSKAAQPNLGFTTADLPGPDDALFDIYISINFQVEFTSIFGLTFWLITNPTAHHHSVTVWGGVFKFYSDLTTDPPTEISPSLNKVYYAENDVDNSIRIKIPLEYGDTNQKSKSIEYYNGTLWKQASQWSIGGVGDPLAIGQLLVQEVISLRTLPRRLITGSFVSTIPTAESRFLIGTDYFLPLSCTKTLDYDTFSGEFLQIAKVTPPDITDIDTPLDDGTGIFGPAGPNLDGDPDEPYDPIPMGFITAEVITATDTLTECDITNTDGVFVENGTVIKILNATTGENENVKLTQAIYPTDTVMYFESHMFVYSFPNMSPLLIVGDIVTIPTNTSQIYQFFHPGYTGTEISAPNFPFVDPELISPKVINIRFNVWRGGVHQKCDFTASADPDRISSTYYFDNVARKWLFYGDGLVNEQILIIAW